MRLSYLALAGTMVFAASAAHADQFTNGSFESGDFTGWTQGGGTWTSSQIAAGYPQPVDYLPGGSRYNASYITNSITSAGFDSRTDNNLRLVYAGQHSAKVNNENQNYSVSVISQRVNNYTDAQISFAYAAVLEGSHGPTDSDAFIITLRDLTTNTTITSITLNSATATTPGSGYTLSSQGWYYNDWTSINIDTSGALNGHDFELSLLANDCPYGGHAGYAYLDGFGSVTGGTGDPTGVPEPATWAMMIMGFGLVGGAMRRRSIAFSHATS